MYTLPCPTAHDAHNNTQRPPLSPLDNNKFPSTATELKTKKPLPGLPHPLSLNILPSPTNKWSGTSQPIKGFVMGYKGLTISYQHFYFHVMTEFSKQRFLLPALLTLPLVMVANHQGALNWTRSPGTTVPWQKTTILPLQSSCWAPARAKHMAIGPAKILLLTFSYVITLY